jgi:hypothetical protein
MQPVNVHSLIGQPIRIQIPIKESELLKVPAKRFEKKTGLPSIELSSHIIDNKIITESQQKTFRSSRNSDAPSLKSRKVLRIKSKSISNNTRTSYSDRPSEGKRELEKRPHYKRGKTVDSADPRIISEIFSKKLTKSDEPPLSFRDPLLSERRDNRINREGLDPNPINLKDLKFSKEYEDDCTAAIISKIAEDLIKTEIEEQAKSKKMLGALLWRLEESPRAIELVGIIQNILIPSSPIFKRLKTMHHRYHFYNETLNNTLEDLTTLRPSEGPHKGLVSKGINLNRFLFKIDNLDKKIKTLILHAFGDSKKSQKEVLEVLRKWSDSRAIKELIPKMNTWTSESIARQNISCIEYIWTEKIDNQCILQPIDKTSFKDMRESYFRDGRIVGKILINGISLEIKEPCDEATFWMEFLSKMYGTFGFEIPIWGNKEQLSLKSQISALIICDKNDVGGYTDETLKCFKLLKMGSIISWGRADMYLRLGLYDLTTDTQLSLHPSRSLDLNKIHYNFYIDKKDPEHSYVEQIKTYNLCASLDHILSEFPVSWKVYSPKQEIWNCCLRILNVPIYEDAGENIPCIEKHMVTFMQNPANTEILTNMNIQTARNTNEDLLADAEGIIIIPRPNMGNSLSNKTTSTLAATPRKISKSAPTIIQGKK